MDQIGTSHIATIDLFICGIALVLFWYLKSPPKYAALSHAIALVSAAAVVAVVIVLLFVDLAKNAVMELAMIALWLCISLSGWNARRQRDKSNRAPTELPREPDSG